jgi:CheY-like chemotaxis protein
VTLRHWGCDALLAGSLAEAQAALRGQPPVDVVLSDMRLGNHADGIAAIETLRAEFGALPAALITGDVAVERRPDVRWAAVPVLQKPVDPAVLRMLLCELAGGSGKP